MSQLNSRIRYWERGGEIHYEYSERVARGPASWRIFHAEGTVPAHIMIQGTEAIESYVYDLVKHEIAGQKERTRKIEAYLRNPDFPIETFHEGIHLRGRIFSATNEVLTVRLEDPSSFAGQKSVRYGWAAAMMRKYILNAEGNFSSDALDTARRLLSEIFIEGRYRKENKDLIDLINRLNGN